MVLKEVAGLKTLASTGLELGLWTQASVGRTCNNLDPPGSSKGREL